MAEKENLEDKEEIEGMPEIPKELKLDDKAKKKLEQIKSKLEKFKKEILKKFDKYILGIALLPPERKKEGEKPSEDINVLVLVDDSDSKKMSKMELRDKLGKIIEKSAEETDKNFKAQVMILTELREACFDAKYEILELVAIAAPIYDPKDLLQALKVAEIHKSMVIKKFEKYVISYVAVGSLFRGDATSNDIDVSVVIDDSDVKRMSRAELKDKLGAIIRSMGAEVTMMTGVKKSFHIQVYILTDFWESIKEASPVIFTFLRDGVPLYDRGVFMPWRLLLEMGRIKPSPEAIDMHMDIGEKLIERAKAKLLSIIGEDIYYAALNPSQAALMLYGIAPPTPKETVRLLDEIFVKKEKILEKKYVELLEKIRKFYKEVEHGKIKEIKGKDIDELLGDVEEYLKRIKKLFSQIEKKTESKNVNEFYDNCIKIVKDVLRVEESKEEDPVKGLKLLVDKGKFSSAFIDIFKNIIKMKNEFRSLTKEEVEKIKKESAVFIRALIEHIQRKRGMELERAKIRVKYGDKYGEVFLLEENAYIISDIDAAEKKIGKAKILPNGGIGKISDSKLEELEEAIASSRIPKKVFIKEKIFEDLKNLFGKDVEILVNY